MSCVCYVTNNEELGLTISRFNTFLSGILVGVCDRGFKHLAIIIACNIV